MKLNKALLSLITALFSTLPIHATAHQSTAVLIEETLAGEHRSPENKARDPYRHPKETLLFFGLRPNMRVLEILPGRGWYTEILAPLLKEEGHLTVASFGAQHPNDYLRKQHIAYIQQLDARPEIYAHTKRIDFKNKAFLSDIESASQDMVLTFRNTHNWIQGGNTRAIYLACHRVLKKNGILGVVQHRANKGAEPQQAAHQGYVTEDFLIQLIEATGLELVAKSELNANPKDSKAYPKGVWTLPPSYRLGEQDRARYTAIGESDRMTLKFIKR